MTLAREIWSILTPSQRRALLAMQLVSLLVAFSTVGGIASIMPFFAALGDPGVTERNQLMHWLYVSGGFTRQRSFLIALGGGFIAMVLAANLAGALGSLLMNRLLVRVGNELQTTLFGEYLSRPYAFHAATNSLTLFNNVVYECSRLTHGVLQQAFVLVTNLVTAALIIVSVLLVKPVVAVAMAAGLAGGYLLIYLGVRNRLLRIGHVQSRFALEQAQVVTESFGAIRDLIILQVRSFFTGRFQQANYDYLLAHARAQFLAQSPKHLMECVAAAGLVGVALVLSGREAGLGSWLGPLTFLAFASFRLLPALQQVFAAIVRIRADRAVLGQLAPELRKARAALLLPAAESGEPRSASSAPLQRAIRLRGVTYRYAPERPWALREVSLQIPARAAVGIVGPNGSGKSTLVDVIAGLLTPALGTVEIDECVLDEGNRGAWQRNIAYVPQHIFLLDASIADNIAIGAAAGAIDEQRLRTAARRAQLDEFVMSLPGGYQHRVGERGATLSGGQRQRIGIARALYRDASVLLMDEATNALDGLTEQELVATLAQLRGRYTIVVIAHRMSTVRTCDILFHMDQGRLVGSGTYDGLVQSSEQFRRMAGIG